MTVIIKDFHLIYPKQSKFLHYLLISLFCLLTVSDVYIYSEGKDSGVAPVSASLSPGGQRGVVPVSAGTPDSGLFI